MGKSDTKLRSENGRSLNMSNALDDRADDYRIMFNNAFIYWYPRPQ